MLKVFPPDEMNWSGIRNSEGRIIAYIDMTCVGEIIQALEAAQHSVQSDGACICPEFTVHPNPLHKECGVCARPPRR
jgi:hypothetical protein